MASFVEVGPGVLEKMKLWTSYRQIDGRRANIIANLSIQLRWVKKKVFDFIIFITFIIYVYQIQFPYPLPFQNQLDPRMLLYLLNCFLFVRNRSFSLKLKLHEIGLMVPSCDRQMHQHEIMYVLTDSSEQICQKSILTMHHKIQRVSLCLLFLSPGAPVSLSVFFSLSLKL